MTAPTSEPASNAASDPIEIRRSDDQATAGRKNPALKVIVVVSVIAAGLALLVTNLGESTTYFKTADEAVAERAELGDRRFRVEGVVTDPVEEAGGDVRFSILSAGVCVDVRHRGDPPELFKVGIPVVLEGNWQGDVYASDRIMVRHSNEYKEENAGRLARADAEAGEYASGNATDEYAECPDPTSA